MKYITIINIVTKSLFAIAIFIFVKHASDYYLVPLLTSLGAILAGGYSLYLIYKKFNIKFKVQNIHVVASHLKGGVHLFLTSALSNLLTSSGTIILSFVSNNTVVGYYSASEKLFRAIVGLFIPVTQALYPISCTKVNQENVAKPYIKKIFTIVGGVALILSLIVALLSKPIVNLIYGMEFINYSYVLAIMMIWLFFGVINNIIGIQYLTAMRKDKVYTYSFVAAAAATVFLNIVLIPHFMIDGILFSMIFGEILLTLSMLGLIFRLKL